MIITGDGSHSLLNKEMNETYHSVHGAVQESQHVFIHHGLDLLLNDAGRDEIRIFEVGFGTGLNALLTCQCLSGNSKKVFYSTVEAFPLSEEIWAKLNYANLQTPGGIFSRIHQSLWESFQQITPEFQLRKLHSTLQQLILLPLEFDLVYFDAFAPNKQPEMWDLAILKKVADAMKPGGILVTYCAKGQLKRDLASLGFVVETLPGPPGKKEMVRARKAV
ncbi:MAG: tRNA (5-methylaminomethyl-2-thiouridine)(34)-methyltransferase MnmD [Cyclobacteriaceae bacterium]|nr:tRNA (5-methylaminomethyl-2-thiouridine)(34)-methyltransferase MnmD [Cyclobacteriaceae bacterium]